MTGREKLMKKLKKFGIKDIPFNAMLPELDDMWKNRRELLKTQKPCKKVKPPKLQEKPKEQEKEKRKYTNTKTTKDLGIECPHCKHVDRSHGGTTHTYLNGNRRMFCGNLKCGKPFMVYKKF